MLLFECFSGNLEGLFWTTGGDQRWTFNLIKGEGRKTWVHGLWTETTWVLIVVGHWARPSGFQSCLTPWTSYLAWGEVPLLTKGDDGDNDDDTTYISRSCVNEVLSFIKWPCGLRAGWDASLHESSGLQPQRKENECCSSKHSMSTYQACEIVFT